MKFLGKCDFDTLRLTRGQSRLSTRPLAEVLEARQLLATITVNTTGDADGADGSNTLSLRQAIEISNGTMAIGSLTTTQASLVSGALATPNTIDFDIPGSGPFTITPTSELPSVANPVVINGYSEPGAHPNTNEPGQGKNTVLQIALNGSQAGSLATGINLLGDNSTIEGLAIGGFYVGVSIGSIMGDLNSNLVEGNFIGTDITGTRAVPNQEEGVRMYVSPYGAGGYNTIGGTAAAAGNVISGNVGNGLKVGDYCLVEGNFIGTDVTGTKALPNGDGIIPAVFLEGFDSETSIQYATSDTIGGTTAGAGNVISGNTGTGLSLANGPAQDNFIGTDVTGTNPLLNGNDAFVGGVGSAVLTGSSTLISATIVSTPDTSYTINFFANPVADGAGSGQGKKALGATVATTDPTGRASFSFTSSQDLQGQVISATAIDPSGNTYGFASGVVGTDQTTTKLIASAQVTTTGQATTFAAVVSATAGGVPTGQVTFLQGGLVIGSAPLNASGIAVFITTSLSAGQQTITAFYPGDSTQAASQSNAVTVSVFAPLAFGGPSVTSDVFAGTNSVTIAFNRGLLAGPADDLANYAIIGPGHRAITVKSAVYDPITDSVTLTTFQDLDQDHSYQLTINGQTGDRVVDVFGIPLNGQKDGKPGHNFAGKIKKAPVVKAKHPSGPKAKVKVARV